MIVRITNGLKNPFVIISIIIGVIAIVLSSYNYYFILVFLFYNFSIACLLVFLIRNHNNSKGIKTLSIFTIAKSTMKPISTQGFVIPGIFKVLLFLIIVLGLISYVVIFGPNQYLPTEQREIFAYENPLFYESDIWVNIATGFYSLLIYLKLLVYPNPLVFYYGFNHIPIVSMTNGWVIFSMILHIALFIFALLGLRQKRLISFAILYYLATISIFANIVIPIPGIVGERLLFMPSLGFSIFLGLVVYKLLSVSVFDKIIIRNKIKILAVAMILLIPYSYKTIARNFNWKDHLTLYLHDIPYLENSLHANSLVASHLFRDINPNPVNAGEKEGNTKKLNLAIKHFNQVLFLDPNDKRTLNNLGTIYYDFFKEYDKAIQYFQKALEVDSSFSYAWFNKGHCHEQLGDHHNAKLAYQQAMKIKDNDIKTISSLARVCFNLGELNEAKELNMLITKIDPLLDLPYLNMAGYHLKLGNEISAVVYFEEAVKINPSNKPLCKKLGVYFTEQGNTDKAAYYHQLAAPYSN
ncbi:MAG TPA: tetratricopeptide repeat protein [Flavobacteriales bacterium]|nr:tetratricopeptide repeat protein [Flavobacteriales bacterium]